MKHIRVRHSDGVWIVETPADTQAFTGGSEAERWARDWAQRLAGEPVQIDVYDLGDQLAGRLLFNAARATA